MDTLCRLTAVETTKEDHEYFYDELHRLVRVVQTIRAEYGQARYGQDRYAGSTERKFLYDELDRLVKVTFENGETIQYEYDAESNLEKLTDVHGNVTRYEYLNDTRLYKVIVERPSQVDRVFTYSYDLAGRLSQIEYPAETGIVAKFDDGATPTPNPGWNANGQLTHLRYLKGGAHLHSFEYDYDDAGNRKTFIDTPQNTANAIRWEYSYNWLNRLAEVKRGDGGATPMTVSLYAYDESDNRIELSMPVLDEVHTYTYDVADQLVDRSVTVGMGSPVVAEEFGFDADGNMVERVLDPNGTPQPTTYTWSALDRLVRIETPASRLSNSYDTDGIRKKRIGSDGVALKSFHSGLFTASEVGQAAGSGEFTYLIGHQLLGFEKNGDFLYFVSDGLSSTRLLVDGTGAEAAHYIHDEFGRRVAVSGGSSSPKTYVGGFSVHDDVPTAGLLYMQQRWYAPDVGRFLSRDPIADDWNLYSYAFNAPINVIDPTGLQGEGALARQVFTAVGTAAAADGPLPIGDLGASVILTGYGAYVLYNAMKRGKFEGSPQEIRADVQRELARITGSKRRRDVEVFERYCNEEEATRSVELNRLIPKPGQGLHGQKWIGDLGFTNPKNLGDRENYTHHLIIVTTPGTRAWLVSNPGVIKKVNEPGRYGILNSELPQFNRRIIRIFSRCR